MMATGKYSMKEIAEKIGMTHQSSFNHIYKKIRGYTPKDFIKKLTEFSEE